MKTKLLILIVLSFFIMSHHALPATSVLFSVLDMTGNTNDVSINIKAVNDPVIWNGSYYWLPATGTNITTTNGMGQINLIPGNYTAVIVGQPQSWALNVTNSATAVPAASLTTGVTFYSGVQTLAGSGGIQISNPAPGQFVIDGSQITGSGGSGVSLWTSTAAGIYANGNLGTNNGWISTSQGIYPQ